MPSLAITGNLGSGKSTALDLISSVLIGAGHPVTRFSADEKNRRLLDENHEIQALIRNTFGDACFTAGGMINRAFLFERITTDPKSKTTLEEILHPILEALWRPIAEEFRSQDDRFFLAEIPLLFEKGLDRFFSRTVVVACSETIRRERLQQGRSLPPEKVTAWLALQQGQEHKISKATHLLWNDGTPDCLKRQISLLFSNVFSSPAITSR
jgi:dephospho-CoA kinase